MLQVRLKNHSPDSHDHVVVLDLFHVEPNGRDGVHGLVQVEIVLFIVVVPPRQKTKSYSKEGPTLRKSGRL